MDLSSFNKSDFLTALQDFFKQLAVPVGEVMQEIPAKDILEKTHKDNETFRLIDRVYFLGTVDDAAFQDGKRQDWESVRKMEKDYDGILIFGVSLRGREGGLLPTRSQLAEISRAFNREFYYRWFK